MSFRLMVLFVLFVTFSGSSQETESSSMLNFPHKYLKYDASSLQLNKHFEIYPSSLYNGLYNLENITLGLFLRPESINVDSPTLEVDGIGSTFKYYLGDSDFYVLSGIQTTLSTSLNSGQSYNFGLNSGLGYDVTKNMKIEGRSFYSLYNTSPDDAFEPVQLVPLQPLSLGLKTKF